MGSHVTRGAFGLVALLVVVGLVGGCAGYKIEENGTGCGYDVYAPEPYLQAKATVSKNAAGDPAWVYDFTLIWLPNYGKRYRVSSWAGLGTANFTFTFTDGWKLSAFTDASNNTNIMTALTTLATPLLPPNPWDGAKSGATLSTVPNTPPVILYRIDFDKDGRPACLVEVKVRPTTACPEAGTFPLHPPCR